MSSTCSSTCDQPLVRLYNHRVTILGLHHVQINVPASRAAEARRFFEDLLGLQQIQRPESLSNAGRNGVWYACGDNEFHVFFAPDGFSTVLQENTLPDDARTEAADAPTDRLPRASSGSALNSAVKLTRRT